MSKKSQKDAPLLDTLVEDGENEEDEISDQSYKEYDIKWYGANHDIDGLVRRFNNKRIYAKLFQRQFVWSRTQASRLIESILLGLPIPSIFLYEGGDGEGSYIIDGLQRMITISCFKNGHWPQPDYEKKFNTEKKTPFRLIGLPEGSRFNGRTYEELDDDDKNKFDEKLIHVLYIEQREPDDNHSSAFHIFERLNTSGKPLQPQEMRNALFEGKFCEHLFDLTQDELWQKMFGPTHRRSKDQELILRFLALLYWGDEYKKPMAIFLNKFMEKHRNADDEKLSEFKNHFTNSLKRICDALGDNAFRHSGQSHAFSAPFFDAFMVAVAKNQSASSNAIRAAAAKLKNDKEFLDYCRAATIDSVAVKGRAKMVKEAIDAER